MSRVRILYGLFWIAWAGFWLVLAHEWWGWSGWITLTALIILSFVYNRVVNWWVPTAGACSFLLFGLCGAIGTWAWSTISPSYEYLATGGLDWVNIGLFWGYIGTGIGKTFMTVDAGIAPEHFRPVFLQFLFEGWEWEQWWYRHRDDNPPPLDPLSSAPPDLGRDDSLR